MYFLSGEDSIRFILVEVRPMNYVLEASPMFPPCYITGGFSTNQQNASVGNMYPPSC